MFCCLLWCGVFFFLLFHFPLFLSTSVCRKQSDCSHQTSKVTRTLCLTERNGKKGMNWVQHFLSAAWSTARPSQTQQHWKCWMVQMTAWCHCTWKPSHLPQHLENTCTHCPFTRGWVIPCYSLLALHHVDVLMFVFIPIQHKVLKYQYHSWVTSYKSWSCLRKCFSFLVGSTCVNKWGGGGGGEEGGRW